MTERGVKFRRRKETRPREVLAAALEVFAERGFAQARLDEIARRAGISKGAIYLYFPSKEELFHAVIARGIAPDIAAVRDMVAAGGGDIGQVLERLSHALPQVAQAHPVGAVAKIVIGESRNFPALARFWHDEVVEPTLAFVTGLIAAAQASGDVRPGDPRLYAVQVLGPVMMGFLWQEVMEPVGARPVPLDSLLRQHLEALRHGILAGPGSKG